MDSNMGKSILSKRPILTFDDHSELPGKRRVVSSSGAENILILAEANGRPC